MKRILFWIYFTFIIVCIEGQNEDSDEPQESAKSNFIKPGTYLKPRDLLKNQYEEEEEYEDDDPNAVTAPDDTEGGGGNYPEAATKPTMVKPGDIIKGQYKRAFNGTAEDFSSFYYKWRLSKLNDYKNEIRLPWNFPMPTPARDTGPMFSLEDRMAVHSPSHTLEDAQFKRFY